MSTATIIKLNENPGTTSWLRLVSVNVGVGVGAGVGAGTPTPPLEPPGDAGAGVGAGAPPLAPPDVAAAEHLPLIPIYCIANPAM